MHSSRRSLRKESRGGKHSVDPVHGQNSGERIRSSQMDSRIDVEGVKRGSQAAEPRPPPAQGYMVSHEQHYPAPGHEQYDSNDRPSGLQSEQYVDSDHSYNSGSHRGSGRSSGGFPQTMRGLSASDSQPSSRKLRPDQGIGGLFSGWGGGHQISRQPPQGPSRSQLVDEIDHLQQELAEQKSLVQRLDHDLFQQRSMSEKLKDSANKMQLRLDSKEDFVGQQLSDDIVLTSFRALFGQVKTWTSTNLKTEPPAGSGIDMNLFDPFHGVFTGREPKDFIQDIASSSKTRKLFFRGCIAVILCREIFGTYSHTWLELSTDRAMGKIEKRLRDHTDPKTFYSWRAFTAGLLSRGLEVGKTTTARENMDLICRPILDAARAWIPKEGFVIAAEHLHTIFRDAAIFSQMLHRQRADWKTDLFCQRVNTSDGHPGELDRPTFVPGDMKDVDEDKVSSPTEESVRRQLSLPVEIFIEPGLFKRGDADGENYDVQTCMSPALVRCLRIPAISQPTMQASAPETTSNTGRVDSSGDHRSHPTQSIPPPVPTKHP